MSGLQILNNMFGYGTPLPDVPVTRNHRIGVYSSGYARSDKDEERLKQQQTRPPKDPNKLKDSEKRVLMIVKCNNGVTGIDVAGKTKWTSNHCSMILTALFRRGLIRRVKQTGEGTRWYKYYKKENDTA